MEQEFPMQPYAVNRSSDISYDNTSSTELSQQSRAKSAFAVQRKALPQPLQRDDSAYEPLTGATNGNTPSQPQKSPKPANVLKWWLPEMIACCVAVACLVAIIIVLLRFNGRLLTDIDLPPTLTLNGIIAAISTVARVALMVPVASGLSQECWVWFSNNSDQQHECRSRLKDLNVSDEASRGVLGSFLFLLFARRRWIAYIGASTTIISLAFGTFTQQLLGIGRFSFGGDSYLAPGNLPRAETWQYLSSRPSEGSQQLPLSFRAALYNGMLTDSINPITVTCATGNCTWPITPSLAICGACSPTTYTKSCGSINCTYTMPSGVEITLGNTGIGDVGFVVNSSSQGSIYNASIGDRLYIVNFEAVGAPYHEPSPLFDYQDITASECALWFCIQSYNTTMVAGTLQQNVTMEFHNLTESATISRDGFDNFTFADIPAVMNPSPVVTYNISGYASQSFVAPLTTLLNGTAILDQAASLTTNDAVEAIWNSSSNLDPWIKNVATSLTNTLRYDKVNLHPFPYGDIYPAPQRSIYDGHAYALSVRVQWYWLILPVACVIMSIVFLILVMITTARSSVVPWKSSLLSLLFFEVDHELKERVSGRAHEWRGVVDAVGDRKVVLREDDGGNWKFKTL